MPILLALVGATGIGKSQLSLEIAERLHAQIIGVDSRQVYKDFAIGTAQPSEQDKARVPHHFVNFLNPSLAYSAGDFCAGVKRLLLANPTQNYIMVGGTGLYLQALTLGLPQIPKIDSQIREHLEAEVSKSGSDNLYKMALSLDPEAMQNVDANNMHRVVRILEVWQGTGRRLSEWQKERVGGIGEIPVYWLNRSRENLYARIDARVDQMMTDGWMDEVRGLAQKVPENAPAWQSLGYRELLHAQNEREIEGVLDLVKRKTRNYAKRQLTWFRWQVKSTVIDLDSNPNPASMILNKV